MSTDSWRVQLELPADTRFLHVVRLTAAGAAAEAGLDAEEVEDVKIAVDELTSVAIAAASPGADLRLRFTAQPGSLRIDGTVPTSDPLAVDEMGEAILSATVDRHTCDAGTPGGFELVKSHRGQ